VSDDVVLGFAQRALGQPVNPRQPEVVAPEEEEVVVAEVPLLEPSDIAPPPEPGAAVTLDVDALAAAVSERLSAPVVDVALLAERIGAPVIDVQALAAALSTRLPAPAVNGLPAIEAALDDQRAQLAEQTRALAGVTASVGEVDALRAGLAQLAQRLDGALGGVESVKAEVTALTQRVDATLGAVVDRATGAFDRRAEAHDERLTRLGPFLLAELQAAVTSAVEPQGVLGSQVDQIGVDLRAGVEGLQSDLAQRDRSFTEALARINERFQERDIWLADLVEAQRVATASLLEAMQSRAVHHEELLAELRELRGAIELGLRNTQTAVERRVAGLASEVAGRSVANADRFEELGNELVSRLTTVLMAVRRSGSIIEQHLDELLASPAEASPAEPRAEDPVG
jgi:hypothetical protein